MRLRPRARARARAYHLIFGSVPEPRSVAVAPLAKRYVIMCEELESGSVARPPSASVSTPVVRSRTPTMLRGGVTIGAPQGECVHGAREGVARPSPRGPRIETPAAHRVPPTLSQ